jgi:hypothetical protein
MASGMSTDGDSGANPRLTIYLDVDGTLLYFPDDGSGREELDMQLPGDGLAELLTHVVSHCEPYWLTYRARLGRRDLLEERLFPHLPDIARMIPVAHWDDSKHEAFDPAREFVWFDDDPDAKALKWLRARGLSHRLVRTRTTRADNPVRMLDWLRRHSAGRIDPDNQRPGRSSRLPTMRLRKGAAITSAGAAAGLDPFNDSEPLT